MNKKILPPVLIILALLLGACGMNINVNIDQGSGKVVTEDRAVSGFDRVVLAGVGDLIVTQGDRDALQIEAEDNIIPRIVTEVSNNMLTISFDKKETVIPTRPVKFHLTMRSVRSLDTQGVGNITAEKMNTDQLELGISGTGNIDLRNLTADQLSINVSGAGNLTTLGKVNSQKVVMSGAGNYDGEDLESKSADITISGLGKVTSWVTDTLDVTISGTGGVDYYGSPRVNQKISGLGRLDHLGNK